MTMCSKPGYIESYGWTKAFLFPQELVAKYDGGEALYLLCEEQTGQPVTIDMLANVVTETYTSGVLNYTVRKGTFDVPAGMVVVQQHYTDICTHDEVDKWGYVAKGEKQKTKDDVIADLEQQIDKLAIDQHFASLRIAELEQQLAYAADILAARDACIAELEAQLGIEWRKLATERDYPQ